MKTLFALSIALFLAIPSFSQTVYNNSACDMNMIFYASAAGSTPCGGNCSVNICVASGGTGVIPLYTACSADADRWDYFEICPSEVGPGCVDCGVPACFTIRYQSTCNGIVAGTHNFTGCLCGTSINISIAGNGNITVN